VNAETRVPAAYVKNGEIVLNVSASATRRLTIDNHGVRFSARFSGASQEVSVPMSAVVGVFAKETGYGFAFASTRDPVASLASATAPEAEVGTTLDRDTRKPDAAKHAARRKRVPRTCRSSSSVKRPSARRVRSTGRAPSRCSRAARI
jgi:stringent starvation protein B